MLTFEADTFNQLYLSALAALLAKPPTVPSRNGLTSELQPCVLRLTDLRHRSLTLRARKKNLGLQLMEFLWIWHGDNRLAPLTSVCKRWADYSDDGVTLHGAYGHRLRTSGEWGEDQIDQCIKLLKSKPDTRQAVMTIWQPEDLWAKSKDLPCNNYLHFLIRAGRLNLTVVVRSNDAWLGLPYNVFNWTQLQCVVAERIGVLPGTYTHVADSLHLYAEHRERAGVVLEANVQSHQPITWPAHGGNDDDLAAAYAHVTLEKPLDAWLDPFWADYARTIRLCQTKSTQQDGLSNPFREELMLRSE